MTTTVTIRDRGQLTIPGRIRSQLSWMHPNQAVRLWTDGMERVVIEPYHPQKPLDWKKLRAQLARVASYKGKRGNLSQFIAQDRYRH